MSNPEVLTEVLWIYLEPVESVLHELVVCGGTAQEQNEHHEETLRSHRLSVKNQLGLTQNKHGRRSKTYRHVPCDSLRRPDAYHRLQADTSHPCLVDGERTEVVANLHRRNYQLSHGLQAHTCPSMACQQ